MTRLQKLKVFATECAAATLPLFAALGITLGAGFGIKALSTVLHGHVSSNRGKIGLSWNIYTRGVIRVQPDSPAALAGIQPGDRVVAVDGDKHKDTDGEAYTLVTLTLERSGRKFDVTLERMPADPHTGHVRVEIVGTGAPQ